MLVHQGDEVFLDLGALNYKGLQLSLSLCSITIQSIVNSLESVGVDPNSINSD